MPVAFRGMNEEPETGRPVLSTPPGQVPLALSARVRLPGIVPGPRERFDVVPASDGTIEPGTGGMSVSRTWSDMPHFTVPRRLRRSGSFTGGTGGPACRIWSHDAEGFTDTPPSVSLFATDLVLRVDAPGHGLVEPAGPMHHAAYASAIAATRAGWRIDEPAMPPDGGTT